MTSNTSAIPSTTRAILSNTSAILSNTSAILSNTIATPSTTSHENGGFSPEVVLPHVGILIALLLALGLARCLLKRLRNNRCQDDRWARDGIVVKDGELY